MQPVIYAADIGSIAGGNFGWARADPQRDDIEVDRDRGGAEIAELVESVARDLADHRPVALGFECPLFVPVRKNPRKLGNARKGEGSRAFSAGAGTGALVTGLVQTAWIMRALRERCPRTPAFLDWEEFSKKGRGLFLWEAFVSGAVKGGDHVDDARIAVAAFRNALPNPLAANAVTARSPLSLIGATLLWSGWSHDTNVLHEPCLVIKPQSPGVAGIVQEPSGAPAPQKVASRDSLHDAVVRVAGQIPVGRWTEYGLVAGIITDDPDTPLRPVAIGIGNELRRDPDIPNAHRILKRGGRVADLFPFPLQMLTDEGVRFLNGRADPAQRWPTAGS